MQHAEYEVELDAAEATLSAIEEQLESDSPVMQAEGAHKVSVCVTVHPEVGNLFDVSSLMSCSFAVCQGTISSTHQQRDLAFCLLSLPCLKLPLGVYTGV